MLEYWGLSSRSLARARVLVSPEHEAVPFHTRHQIPQGSVLG